MLPESDGSENVSGEAIARGGDEGVVFVCCGGTAGCVPEGTPGARVQEQFGVSPGVFSVGQHAQEEAEQQEGTDS